MPIGTISNIEGGLSVRNKLNALITGYNSLNSTSPYNKILDYAGLPLPQRTQLEFNGGFTVADDPGDGITQVNINTSWFNQQWVPLSGTISGYPLTGPIEFSSGSTALWQSSGGSGFLIGTGDNPDLSIATSGGVIEFADQFVSMAAFGSSGSADIEFGPNSWDINASDSLGKRSILAATSGSITVSSTNTGFSGLAYNSAAGGFVMTNQSSLTILHRAAGDARWAQLTGANFTGNVNGVTPTELTYLSGATSNLQNQINNINSGLSWKAPIRVLVDSNINISSPGSSLGGVTMSSGDRVLLISQTTTTDNGPYVWNGPSSPMTRCPDAATGAEMLQSTYGIEEGTYGDQIWMCSTNGPITIGTTALSFIKTSATTYTASAGITLSGNNFILDNTYFTGDATISGGVISIGAGKITNTMLAGPVSGQNGGTGVANTGKTITLGGNLTTTGAFNTSFTQQASVTLTLPPSNVVIAGSASALTSGRVPYATSNGILMDGTNLTVSPANGSLTITTFSNTAALVLNSLTNGATIAMMYNNGVRGFLGCNNNLPLTVWNNNASFVVASFDNNGNLAVATNAAPSGKFNVGTAFQVTSNNSVVVGSAALATNATDGFLYIATCAGTPTGTPTAFSGRVPLVYDSVNHILYIYDGGWKGATVPGTWS